MFSINQNKYCLNCGKTNHKINQCTDPITSYGIITFSDSNNICLVCRKYSLSFIDFMMGKYDSVDIIYICNLFLKMSIEELIIICFYKDYNNIRSLTGLTINNKYHKHEYEDSENKFIQLVKTNKLYYIYKIIKQCITNKYVINIIDIINKPYNETINNSNSNRLIINNKDISNYVNKILSTYNNSKFDMYYTPEWEIPKGRRNYKETDVDTSIREFKKKTGLYDITLFNNVLPLDEFIYTTSKNKYKHVYYLGEINNTNKFSEFILETNNYHTNYLSELLNDEIIISNNTLYNLLKKLILTIKQSLYELYNNNKIIYFYNDKSDDITNVVLISVKNIDSLLRNYQIEKKKVIYKSYQIYSTYNNYFALS